MANPFRPTTSFYPFFSRVLIDGQIWGMEAGENKRIASFATREGKGSVIPSIPPAKMQPPVQTLARISCKMAAAEGSLDMKRGRSCIKEIFVNEKNQIPPLL